MPVQISNLTFCDDIRYVMRRKRITAYVLDHTTNAIFIRHRDRKFACVIRMTFHPCLFHKLRLI